MNIQVPASLGAISLPQDVVDALLPMHVRCDPTGTIVHVGPTCAKMVGDEAKILGRNVLDVFNFKRPTGADTFEGLMLAANQRLTLSWVGAEHLTLRGVIQPLSEREGAILDLSFGLSFARAVAEFSMNLSDFAVTDQTVELLYLHEAKASTMRLSEHLTNRLQDAHATAQAQAHTDVLTGLSNRRAMDDELQFLMASRNKDFTLLHLDLDLFKQVNDTHGHAAGDYVLKEVGRILDSELRRNDFPARVGGDEFLIVLRPAQTDAVVSRIAKRIIQRIEEPIGIEGGTVQISASIGVTSTTNYPKRPSIKQMMEDVDKALYSAKHNGRGQHVFFRPEEA